jgi:hypothetical protein
MTNKRDAFQMTQGQVAAGRRLWQKTGQQGRLAKSSFDAESTAPKTWILWANGNGEEIATIECELYTVARASDSSEAIGMLVGMCPKCSETFMVREDNKQMSVEYRPYRKCPPHLRVNWAWHCRKVLARPPSDEDKIAIVSSGERWACDYCRGWCVRVTDGVAIVDMTGVTQVAIHGRPHLIGGRGNGGSEPVDF